jgi:hypothetical protein
MNQAGKPDVRYVTGGTEYTFKVPDCFRSAFCLADANNEILVVQLTRSDRSHPENRRRSSCRKLL